MSLTALLTSSGDVYGHTDTRDDSGGLVRADTARATAQPCRVQDASANQQMIAASRGLVVTHLILTEYAGTLNGDTWRVDGSVYRVVGIKQRRPIGGMAGHYVIDAEEVRN